MRFWHVALFAGAVWLPAGLLHAAEDSAVWQQHMERAAAARQRGDLRAAIHEYTEAVKLNPSFAPAYMNIGLLEYASRNYGDALAPLQKATRLDPKLGPAWLYQGLVFLETGRYADALKPFEAARRLMPRDPQPAFHLGRTCLLVGQPQRAVEVLEHAEKLDSRNVELIYTLAQAYLQLAHAKQDEILKIDPDHYRVYEMLGQLYEQQNDFAAAESEYREMIRKYPERRGGHALMAALYERMGNSEGAKKEYQAELALSPFDAATLVRASALYFQDKQIEDAAKLAARSIAINPEIPEARKLYAQCLLEQSRPAEALAQLEAAVRLDAGDRNSHFLLARALRETGDDQRAAREMEIFQKLTQEWNALEKERRGRLEKALRRAGVAGDGARP